MLPGSWLLSPSTAFVPSLCAPLRPMMMKDIDANARISQLEEHVRRHPYELGAKSIGNHSFYSYRHSNRLFSAQTGESIQSFAAKIRLQKAAEYLKYSSKDMLDIALLVGYETSASFSKAFKKGFGISPTAYREKHKNTDYLALLEDSKIGYRVGKLSLPDVQCKKVLFDLGMPAADFYELIKAHVKELSPHPTDFLLLWDEDPETLQLSQGRCFVAIQGGTLPSADTPPVIEGKYAQFESASLDKVGYQSCHKLAFMVLEQDEVPMRESTYVEFFSSSSLQHIALFFPYKMALAIE